MSMVASKTTISLFPASHRFQFCHLCAAPIARYRIDARNCLGKRFIKQWHEIVDHKTLKTPFALFISGPCSHAEQAHRLKEAWGQLLRQRPARPQSGKLLLFGLEHDRNPCART